MSQALDNSRIFRRRDRRRRRQCAVASAGSVVVNDISPTIIAEITSVPAVSGGDGHRRYYRQRRHHGFVRPAGQTRRSTRSSSNAAIAANGGLAGLRAIPASISLARLVAEQHYRRGHPRGRRQRAVRQFQCRSVDCGQSYRHASLGADRSRVGHIDWRRGQRPGARRCGDHRRRRRYRRRHRRGGGQRLGRLQRHQQCCGRPDRTRQPTQRDTSGAAAATVDAAAVSVVATRRRQDPRRGRRHLDQCERRQAVGLSAAINQIGTYVSAAIAGGHVTADNSLTDNSPLIAGSLQAGSVLVSGSSNADIISVAIGVAISVGDSQSTHRRRSQSRLAGGEPCARRPTQLTGGGAARVRPPTPPPAPPPPPVPPSTGMSGAGSFALSTETDHRLLVDRQGRQRL